MRTLFELAADNSDIRFSPFVWRARFALLHKGLDFVGEPVRFIEKDKLKPFETKTVPVLVDGDQVVVDSFAIARYLDHAYPSGRPLLGAPVAESAAGMIDAFLGPIMFQPVIRQILMDVYNLLDAENQAYFRATREKFFGKTLEQIVDGAAERLPALRAGLAPLRSALGDNAFFCGDSPAWPDYQVMSIVMWVRCTSAVDLFEAEDTLRDWSERMLDAFGGHARAAARAV